MKYFRKYKVFITAILIIFLFSGCGNNYGDIKDAPKMKKYVVETSNNGSDNSQFVTLFVTYDRPISVKKDTLKGLNVNIGGNKITNSNCIASIDKKNKDNLMIKISVDGITSGEMTIDASDNNGRLYSVTDESGKSSAVFNKIHCLVPTGLKLKTLESVTGDGKNQAKVIKQVISTWKVRGIAWILFSDNGKPVIIENKNATMQLNGAVAVHGHDFLTCNDKNAASDVVEVLKENFGAKYNFTASENKIIAQSKTLKKGENLDVQILSDLNNR